MFSTRMVGLGVTKETLASDETSADGERLDGAGAGSAADAARARAILTEHFRFVWRLLRRLVPSDAVDDATQQTLVIAARKVNRIAHGSERAYLFKTALRVAAFVRRTRARRREVPGDEALEGQVDARPLPDELADRGDRRKLLDEVLDAMPLELRTVFVLFELEGMPTEEIAALLDIPGGTAKSRLRRARDEFQTQARRVRARLKTRGENP